MSIRQNLIQLNFSISSKTFTKFWFGFLPNFSKLPRLATLLTGKQNLLYINFNVGETFLFWVLNNE